MFGALLLRIKLLICWVSLSFCILSLYHSVLGFPLTPATYGAVGVLVVLVLFSLFKPGYTQFFLALFAPPFLFTLVSIPYLQTGWRIGTTSTYLFLCALAFAWYLRSAVIRPREEILQGLSRLERGVTSRHCSLDYYDEQGQVIRELNRLMTSLKEKEILSQFISPEVWQEIQKESDHHRNRSQEKWVYVVLMQWEAEEAHQVRRVLDICTEVAREYSAFLNHFDRQRAELFFLPGQETNEKTVLLAYSEIYARFKKSDFPLRAVLSHSYVKMGVVFQSEGYRYRCHGDSLENEHKLLVKRKGEESVFLVSEKLKGQAQQVFHLQEDESSQLMINGEKDIEFHLQNLRSARVEDKLVSIRVIATHGYIEGLDALLELLDDVSPRVRIAATNALAQLVTPQTEEKIGRALLKGLAKEWNNDNRATLVISLGDLRRKEFVSPLFELLRDENDRVRANAVEAIGRCMERKTVLRYLEEMLQDQNNRARANACMATWLMGERRGFEELINMASSEDNLTSCSGLYGIGEVFTDENIRITVRFLPDPVQFYFREQKLFHQAISVCIEKIFEDEPLLERNAILALQKIRSRASISALQEKFNSTDQAVVKQMVIDALLAMEEFQLVSRLREEKTA